MELERPPCWPDGQPCPNPCAAAQHRRIVWNQLSLRGDWTGWHFAGARLVSPHKDWITAPVLDRLIYRRGRLYQLD
jgi:hypothetical protein